MAITQFTEPDINLFFDDLNQATRLTNKASFVGRGYINIGMSNISNTEASVFLQGSVFECGNALFLCVSDTGIEGTPVEGKNYIYFDPSDNKLYYYGDEPAWNTIKGGWYNGNKRAILTFYYANGKYYMKQLLSNQQSNMTITGGSMGSVITNREILSTPIGVLVESFTTNPSDEDVRNSVYLRAGKYCFQVKGGGGGGGGAAGPVSHNIANCVGQAGELSYIYSTRNQYALVAFGGGAGGGGHLRASEDVPNGSSSLHMLDLDFINEEDKYARKIAEAPGGTYDGSGSTVDGSPGYGGGNNRDLSVGGGAAGQNGGNSSVPAARGGTGQDGGGIIEMFDLLDTSEFIVVVGKGGVGTRGDGVASNSGAGGVGGDGSVSIYKVS
jgi:hypothetical protein